MSSNIMFSGAPVAPLHNALYAQLTDRNDAVEAAAACAGVRGAEMSARGGGA